MDNKASSVGPLISIITVTYNDQANLEKTILSVIALKRVNIEFIVIDGGSNDGTVELMKKYNGTVNYWCSEPDSGIYDAMNKGWEKANDAGYVMFLGAGDLLINLPDDDSFKKGEIIAGYVEIGCNYLYKPKADIRLKLGNTLHHQSLLIKKSLHRRPPFDLRYKTYADFDFNQRLYKEGHKIYVDQKFRSYALEGGLSAKFDRQQSLAIVRKNFGWIYMALASIYYLLRHEV
ncbi:MAG: glycosyltransferase family 2 protein [Mucilaginibacter sp.]